MSGRLVRRGSAALAVLLLLVACAIGAYAYLPAFEDSRRALAGRLLERLVERPVSIDGPVGIRLGWLTEVVLERVTIGDAGPEAWRGSVALDQGRIAFPTLPALLGDFSVDHAAGRGLEIVLDGAAASGTGPLRVGALVKPIARFLGSPLTRAIDLQDVRIKRRAGAAGWSGEVTLDRATAVTEADGNRVIILDGGFNDRPLALTARFSPPTATIGGAPARSFTIKVSLPGLEETLEGVLRADGEALEADVTVTVSSIGDLLETLLLQRQLEGTGGLRMRVAGSIDALTAEDVRVDATLASGQTASLDGRIADLSALAGIDLALLADLEQVDGEAVRPSQAFDIELRRLAGRLTGSLAALTVSSLAIQTSIASADLAEIGPIGVERVTRDRAGRLGLQGLTIKNGDPAAPSLDLAGSVDDLLGGEGIRLAGSFDLDLLELATGRPAPPAVGRLAGTLALTDVDGRLRLQRFSARLVGTGEVSLALDKPPPRPDDASPQIAVTLDIPDLDALAAAQGVESIGGGAASFEGTLSLVDNARLIGRGRIGRSPVWLDLTEDVAGDEVELRGAVKSPGLRLADLPRITGLATLWPTTEEARAKDSDVGAGVTAAPGLGLDAELDTEATIVDSGGSEQGAFNARLTIRDRTVRLRPLRLRYLGGQAFAELSLDLAAEPPLARLDAKIEALQTAALLTELGIQPLLVGELDATVALAARGANEAALRRTLDGTVALAMGEGRIGSRLIDLTAQNLVSWLFSAGSETRLLCAAARLGFASGLGTVEGLLLKTDNVQLLGAGTVDLAGETIDLQFDPRPSRGGPLQTVTPFRVHGPLQEPRVELRSTTGIAGRAVLEALTLPLNVLGAIFGGGGPDTAECVLDP